MTSIRYYYADEQNQPVGPFGLADLEKMLGAGVIGPDSWVCPEGGEDWVALQILIGARSSIAPPSPPPGGTSAGSERHARIEKNAFAAATAAILFPVIMSVLTLAVAANPAYYAIERAMGTGFLLFLLFFVVGLLGPINAFKLIRIPGVAARRPAAVTVAWIGIVLFVLALGSLLLVGFGMEAEMARRAG